MFLGGFIHYKIYRGSIHANILVVIGIILKCISWICLFILIALLMYRNPDVEYHLSIAIPVIIGIGLSSLLIAIFLDRKAEYIGDRDFKNRIINDLEFAKKIAKLSEKNKGFCVELNSKYAEYIKSGQEELEKKKKKSGKAKTIDMIRNIVVSTLLILILAYMFYFFRSL